MEVFLQLRPDLQAFAHDEGDGERLVVLKDPITDRFFRVTPHEHALLRTVDGTRTLSAAREAFRRSGQYIAEDEAKVVLARADAMGLLLRSANSRGEVLYERHERGKAAKRAHLISELFFVFVPLVNPDRFLARTLWLFRLFVNRVTGW